MAGRGYYDGPVCFVGENDSAVTIDGELAEGGWHYSAVVDEEAKQIALEQADQNVALWEKRAAARGLGRFAQSHLDQAEADRAAIREASFHVPGVKLHLEDTSDGSQFRFREAKEEDERSWADRKHQSFATFQLEDQAQQGIRVTEEELAVAQKAIAEFRKEGQA